MDSFPHIVPFYVLAAKTFTIEHLEFLKHFILRRSIMLREYMHICSCI
jgi:hypothetical protein